MFPIFSFISLLTFVYIECSFLIDLRALIPIVLWIWQIIDKVYQRRQKRPYGSLCHPVVILCFVLKQICNKCDRINVFVNFSCSQFFKSLHLISEKYLYFLLFLCVTRVANSNCTNGDVIPCSVIITTNCLYNIHT